MGYKIIRSKPIIVKSNEEKDLKFKLRPEKRGVIHGTIVDPDDNPVKDALVKLFEKKECDEKFKPIGFQFTDKYGQYLFPVEADIEYVLKIFYLERENCTCSINDEMHVECETE